jgi:lipopolysaccharide export system permease protein
MVSNQGTEQRLPNGDRYLVLRNGHRYEGESGSGEYSIMGFEKYAILVESRGEASAERSPKSMPTQDLLRSREHNAHGELLWRISMPIAAALLVVVAVPLAYVNPRAGRSSNLLLAVLTYMVYNNLISVSQAWVAQGKLSFGAGLAGVHLLMLVITWYGFRHRMRQGVRR